MVLPKVLEDILRTVQETHLLQNWSIFHDRDGYINFRLRFEGHNTESVIHDQPICYRRKTQRQVHRDYTRSRAWQSRRQVETSTQCEDPMECVTPQSDPTPNTVSEPVTSLNPDAPAFTLPVSADDAPKASTEDTVQVNDSMVIETEAASTKVCPITSNAQIPVYSGVTTRSMAKGTPELLRASDTEEDLDLHFTPEPTPMSIPPADSFSSPSLVIADSDQSDIDSDIVNDCCDGAGAGAGATSETKCDAWKEMNANCAKILEILDRCNDYA